jgi:hypothetical protein
MARNPEHPPNPDGEDADSSDASQGSPEQNDTPRSHHGSPLDAMANPSLLKAVADAQKGIDAFAGSSTMRAIADMQKRLASPPMLKAVADAQKGIDAFAGSPTMRAIADMQKRLSLTLESPMSRLLDGLSSDYTRVYEAVTRLVDREWAERDTENPEHPHPALFVVASLPMALGYPIYIAAKRRRDDSQLLDLVEPVLTNPEFIAEVIAAVEPAPYINAIAKEHLTTALDWLGEGEYVKAYPPFYNGLEAALFSVARARKVVDKDNNFVHAKGKARKADDLLPHLVSDPRYRRYLRAWIFGDVGNPFRHGDVAREEDCRRQSLRLAVAVIGWLEIYGGWTADRFAAELEAQAAAIDEGPDEAAA